MIRCLLGEGRGLYGLVNSSGGLQAVCIFVWEKLENNQAHLFGQIWQCQESKS